MKGKKVILNIVSIQSDGEEQSKLELISEGYLSRTDDGFEVSYDESDATGFDGSHTKITVRDGGYVIIERSGSASSYLILEQGRKHLCRYGTPYGELSVAVSTSRVFSNINGYDAQLDFHYSIEVNSGYIGEFDISITAKPET